MMNTVLSERPAICRCKHECVKVANGLLPAVLVLSNLCATQAQAITDQVNLEEDNQGFPWPHVYKLNKVQTQSLVLIAIRLAELVDFAVTLLLKYIFLN